MKISFFCVVLLACSSVVLAGEPTGLSWLQQWKQHPTFLRFDATLPSDTAGALPDHLTGVLQVSPTGLFRLVMHGAFEQTIVNDGHTVWLWDHALNQVTKTDIVSLPQDSPFTIFTRAFSDVLKQFRVTMSAVDVDRMCYRFVPYHPSTALTSADLCFVSGQPRLLSIQKERHTAPLVLSIHPVRQSPTPVSFRFVVPPGVDVLDTRQGEK